MWRCLDRRAAGRVPCAQAALDTGCGRALARRFHCAPRRGQVPECGSEFRGAPQVRGGWPGPAARIGSPPAREAKTRASLRGS
ncbi:hypothetical protein [Lysobacter gummosus]|uniref:hypothetical protein n=1 Tax=Lysobacter gummosus TaxID=262324 RepID=UPI003641D91D